MFGISAFCEAPYSSLPVGGGLYDVSVVEAAFSTDATSSTLIFNGAVSELANSTDSISSVVTYLSRFQDAANATDSILARATFASLIQEAASAQDTQTVAPSTFNAVFADTVNADPSVSSITFKLGAVVESANVSDAPDADAVFPVRFVDAAGVSSTNSALVDFAVRIAESLVTADNTGGTGQFVAKIQESVRAIDVLIARSLWEPINTTQPDQWTPVVTVQVALQTTGGGGFSFGPIASGPFSGLGTSASILPITEVWRVDETAQPADWTLVDTIN